MSALDELEQALRHAVEQAGPAVVSVAARGQAVGAGVVIGDGQVLTNAHNALGDRVTVALPGGRVIEGHPAAVDVDADVAIIAVDTAGTSPITWAPQEPVRIGAPVIALSTTRQAAVRATLGFVSATDRTFRGPRGRRISGAIEHTAPLPHGSSGGPIVDREGRLLGVNTHRLGDGFYFALPADADLRARVDALARGEARHPVRLGVAIAPAHAARRLRAAVGLAERDGLLIRAVEDDSPAERAGLRRGDLIVAAGSREVSSADELFDVLDELAADASLRLRVVRGAEELELRVALSGTRAEGEA